MKLTEADQKELLRRIYEGLSARGVTPRKSEFMDVLALRTVARHRSAEGEPADEAAEPEPLDPAGIVDLVELVVDELLAIRLGEYFSLIERVVLDRDDAAFQEILQQLETRLKIRGLLYRRGLNPEQEYPALWSKIWEALPKWDGRDFRAYVAQLVRNYCLDDLKRRKKAPGEIVLEPGDARPTFKTEAKASTRDALDHVLSVIEDLEREGDLAPLDGVIFSMLTAGRMVQDIVAAFTGPAVQPFTKAVRAIGGKKKLTTGQALAVRYLVDGLDADEVAVLTGLDAKVLAQAGKALASIAGASEDDQLLVRGLAREGVAAQDVERLEKLTANAVNLRINRARLKVWMALCDRAYDVLRRRGEIDDVDLAIVQHRCSVDLGIWCRMYKDRECKRERSPAEIARRAGLDVSESTMTQRVSRFREKILDGLGRAFPDYNSCLNERKPDRHKP